jgi:arylsulfatase A-like enzyme
VVPETSADRGVGATPGAFTWRRAFLCALLAAYLYVFMEWLFFVTKPSFMTPMGGWERAAVFLGTAPLAALAATLAMLPLWVLARTLPERAGSLALRWLGFAVPAAVVAGCLFLLIDNFTYTIFRFGVLTTRGLWRFPYALLVAGLWVWSLRKFARGSFSAAGDRWLARGTVALVFCSALSWFAQFAANASEAGAGLAADLRANRMPDILMLASDGVEASHMSAYGYERDTTPFIRSWMKEALVAENAFPNATSTSGTVVAMLTSKLPTHTRVLQYQNILTGRDSFDHLPGILRDLGYRSKHVSVLLFADPSAVPRPWNMRNAFDDYERFAALPPVLAVPYSSNAHFLGQMIDRIGERALHATGAATAKRRREEILSAAGTTDAQRIDAVLDFMEASEQPAFAHLHLMDTHPPYQPRKLFFPDGETEGEKRSASYDSTIRTFDEHVEGIVERLQRTGRLDDTVVVLSSDHGRKWSFTRVPLLFFFPDGEHRASVRSNVQMLDVAPTLLDYLGLPISDWMEGRSLLEGPPDPAPDRDRERRHHCRAPFSADGTRRGHRLRPDLVARAARRPDETGARPGTHGAVRSR